MTERRPRGRPPEICDDCLRGNGRWISEVMWVVHCSHHQTGAVWGPASQHVADGFAWRAFAPITAEEFNEQLTSSAAKAAAKTATGSAGTTH